MKPHITERNGVYTAREEREVGVDYLPVEDVIKAIQEASEGLTDAKTELTTRYDYGDESQVFIIFGTRPATDEEIAEYQEMDRQRDKEMRERDEQSLRRLRQTRPELFR